ncbi:MAG TPA: DUF4129 domain-containing protein [Thermoplasmata archaeon]|jgi:hypothetical protein|nr:DUF4129 domain-containing protein [Thermoplasmata archaeon]
MSEVGRRQVQLLVPLLTAASVVLLGLLAFNLRNLDPGNEELPPAPTIEPNPGTTAASGSGQWLRTLFVGFLLSFLVIIGVLSVLLARKGVKVWKLVTVWELLGYLLATVFIVSVFLYWTSVQEGLNAFVRWVTGTRDSGGGGSGTLTGPTFATTVSNALLVVAVAVVLVYLVLFGSIFLPRLYRVVAETPPDIGRSKRELAAAMRTAVRDLEAGGDFRAIVLRCYRSMVYLFEARGLKSDPSETAREFEESALGTLGVSREGIDDLTSLFEEARYSTHAIGERQRDAAIDCLNSIRGLLEAGA